MRIKILLWNTEGNKQNLEILLEEAKYDLLAIQEPWINKETKSTYCPRSSKYHLVFQREGKAAIYVSKRFETGQWDAEATDQWCRVWFPELDLGQGRGFELWSIYNLPGGNRLANNITSQPPPVYSTVVTGDFNLHHPCWDQFDRYNREAESLLQLALQWDLVLVTPKGAVTRAPQGRQRGRTSTLDLIWATEGLQTAYWGEECRGKSDHYPQVLEVGSLDSEVLQPNQPTGWSWRKMDKKRVAAEAALLPRICRLEDEGPEGLRQRIQTTEGLKEAFDWLVDWLTQLANASTPRRRAQCGHQAQWWNEGIREAVREARRAERTAKEAPSNYAYQQLNQRLRELSATIRSERTRAWRALLQEASKKPELLWNLERWARKKSALPPDPPKLPALQGPQGQPELVSHNQKAKGLSQKFFPNPPADLSSIRDRSFQEEWEEKVWIKKEVTPGEIAEAVAKAAPWKAPGADRLPMGFLKACGKPLYQVLAVLTTRCFELGWYPDRFKEALTVVLQKPGKPPAAYKTAGGYRPIALLPTLGKVIEAVVAKRVTQASEEAGLLPDEQMGNRANRSTELAVRLVVAQVHEAWRQKATASLLLLDIAGAFDTVNHTWLLATLREAGFPKWLVLWVMSWLTDRKATLYFDGKAAPPVQVKAGVPQGSPLSPILFILFIASLYRALQHRHPQISLAGFADDTNLMAFSRNPEANARQLEAAWKTCLEWAEARGMAFAPEKSELIHFNKGRRQWQTPVNLTAPQGGSSSISPSASARFLGVWLDWKLNWKAHREAVEKKLRTQDFALSRIAAKTWGPSLAKAREVYTKCIRAAIAFGASTFHSPTPKGGKPRGIAKDLAKAQNRSLRIVVGAYKATPIRNLETEAWVPPLDLYLNKRRADFEQRAQGTGQIQTVIKACTKLFNRFKKRRRTAGPQQPTKLEEESAILQNWTGGSLDTDGIVLKEWEARWLASQEGKAASRPADDYSNPEALFTDLALQRHEGLTKAQSSLFTQMRTGAIGLRSFLFQMGVREVVSPYCGCGEWEQTVEHLVVWCREPPKPRTWPEREIRSRKDLYWMLQGIGRKAARLARRAIGWLMDSGLLQEYSLARRLELEAGED